MPYKISVKERGLPDGRVSLEALIASANVVRIAIRARTIAGGMRARSGLGRRGTTARDASGLSLAAVAPGSGVLVFEPEHRTLFNAPDEAFRAIVEELSRGTGEANGDETIRKGLLTLEPLFESKRVEFVEFSDSVGRVGRADPATLRRIRLSFPTLRDDVVETSVIGRLMEIDVASRSIRVDDIAGSKTAIRYDVPFEPAIVEAISRYVTAGVRKCADGGLDLSSIDLAELPASSFYDVPAGPLAERLSDARVVSSIDDFAMVDAEEVTGEEFARFLHSLRTEA